MPQVSAAVRRSAPSSTIARASIRRAAEPSFSRPAAARRSFAVKSGRMILTAPPIDAAPLLRASIESEFPRFGNPKMSQKPRPLVLLSSLWDAAFDGGLITFDDEGRPIASSELTDAAIAALQPGNAAPLPLTPEHRVRLAWHRTKLWQR